MNVIVIANVTAAIFDCHGLSNSSPPIPKISEGIPDNRSMNVPSILCCLPPDSVYSAKYIPAINPIGNAIAIVNAMDISVFIIGIASPPICCDDRYPNDSDPAPYISRNVMIAPRKNTPNSENTAVNEAIIFDCLLLYFVPACKMLVVVEVIVEALDSSLNATASSASTLSFSVCRNLTLL